MLVKVSVTQITHGSEYEGTIEGLGNDIKYQLSFGVPIDRLDSQKMPDDKSKVKALAKKMFGFTITKSDKQLEISDELFGFMVGTAGQLAISFYNNPQTEDYVHGSGILSDAIKNKDRSLLGAFGAKISIGMSNQFNIPDIAIPSVLV